MSRSKFRDVVICGAGLVGAALASRLSRSSALSRRSILVLDAANPPAVSSGEQQHSNRVVAVSPGSVRMLERLGALEHISRHGTVRQLRVAETCSQSVIRFDTAASNEYVALVMENTAIVNALHKTLGDVELEMGRRIEGIDRGDVEEGDLVQIRLDNGDTVETQLLIGADGPNSAVRRALHSDYTAWDYDQKAIVATLEVETDGPNQIAWQRFTTNGPIALLPLREGVSSLVWSTTVDEADRLLQLQEDTFVDELNEALTDQRENNSLVNSLLHAIDSVVPRGRDHIQFPEVISAASRAAFPLGFGHSHNYVDRRLALIGDAAHRCHPLAGQGVNLGWRDVQSLSHHLDEAARSGADLGSLSHLLDYESDRQTRNATVMLTLDWLKRLYGSDLTPVVLARSLGLDAVNRLDFVKRFITSEASL